ncbi:hypothetical protein KA344_11875 [bacterium]|jgi:hypothetical protein|nr:hypothetical protein [bacterium]
MPKTSQLRLSTVILSASLLLATAGSANASNANAEDNASTVAISSTNINSTSPITLVRSQIAPADSPITSVHSQSAIVKNPSLAYLQAKTLQGSVSSATTNLAVHPPVQFLDDLTESALHIKQSLKALGQAPGEAPGQAAGQSANTLQNMNKSARSFVPNYFDYRPSRAAAQVFLGSARQQVDEEEERSERNRLALTLTASMMQIAKGLGDSDSKAAALSIEHGRNKLTQLLGRGQADWVITRMTSWAAQVKNSLAAANSGESDVLDQEEQVSALVARAVARDQQINNLKAAIGIHDHAPTGAERSLTLAGLTPTLIGPAAKLAQYAVERGTGGTRSKRLDEVLTLGVAMQERINLLNRESELAINNLERARSSKNDVLYVFAKDLITKLGGP